MAPSATSTTALLIVLFFLLFLLWSLFLSTAVWPGSEFDLPVQPKCCFAYPLNRVDAFRLLITPLSFQLNGRFGRVSHGASAMDAVLFEVTFVDSPIVVCLLALAML